MLQRGKLEAAAEDGHRLLELLDRGQRRGDADVAVKRVVSIRIGRARARHHDARILGERQRTLGKAGGRVHGDKVAALGRVPARNAERLDLTLERFDDHVELRLHDFGVLFHQREGVLFVLEILDVAQLVHLVEADGLNADELGHVLHVGFAARKARNARAGERHLARGSELENHVGVAVLLALAQNILERDELAVKLVDAVGIVPHEQEVGSRGLHLRNALDGLVGVDDAVGVRVLRHVPHALDARVLDEVFDNVHVGAVFGHRDGDELKAEALGHLEVAVIARCGAEPFDALFLAPRLFAVQQAVSVGLGDRVVHELEARIAAGEDLRGLAAEDIGEQLTRALKPLEFAVVAGVHAAVHALLGTGQRGQDAADHVELLLARLAARHVELEALGLPALVFGGHLVVFALAMVGRYFNALHCSPPPCWLYCTYRTQEIFAY